MPPRDLGGIAPELDTVVPELREVRRGRQPRARDVAQRVERRDVPDGSGYLVHHPSVDQEQGAVEDLRGCRVFARRQEGLRGGEEGHGF